MKLILFLMLLMLLFASCEKKVDWALETGGTDPVVVDGMITDELKVQSIRLIRIVQSPNDEPETVTGAQVIVTVGANIYQFHEDPHYQGRYVSDTPFRGVIGEEHSLLITHQNVVYSAKAGMAGISSTFDKPVYEFRADTGLYHFIWVASAYSPIQPAMYELLLDWSDVAGFELSDSLATHARLCYYTLSTLDVSEVFAPSAQTIYFPSGTKITERRYALTTEHAAYFRALLSETTWQGGYFSSASANVPTNLSSGAIGFFGACSVTSRTDVVK
jgi:hypothetical protein